MARPNINLTVAGDRSFQLLPSGNISHTLVPRNVTVENTSGTSRRKPSGWIPPTPYTVSATYRKGAIGTIQVLNGSSGYIYGGVVGPTDNSGPVNIQAYFNRALFESEIFLTSQLEQRALSKALSNLRGKSIDLGVAFGERNATARMIGDTANRLAKAARSLRRGQVRDAMRALGLSTQRGAPRHSNWTKNWLELQYGWKPFLSDVFGACEALSGLPREAWRVSSKGSVRESISGTHSLKPMGSDPTGYICTAAGWRGAFVRLDAIPTNELLSSLSSVGVVNPLTVAWELVPLSFVADWIIPIGDWLNSLDAALGYSNISVCTSSTGQADWQLNGVSGVLSNGTVVVNNYVGSKRLFQLSRKISSDTRLSLPRFKNPLSFGHMANGLSLLAQAFR